MKLWISGEIDGDIGDEYRNAIVPVEDVINDSISACDYGDGIADWDLIGIVMSLSTKGFPEIRRYIEDEKGVEFRLLLEHSIFLEDSEEFHRQKVFEFVLRSICEARNLPITDFDLDAFEKDVIAVGRDKGWVTS